MNYGSRKVFAARASATGGLVCWLCLAVGGLFPGVAFADLQPTLITPLEVTSADGLRVLDDQLVRFRARTPTTGSEMWISDGTAAGTQVIDMLPGSAGTGAVDFGAFAGGHIFNGADSQGYEPWFTDLTVAGSRRLADLNPGAGSSSPRYFNSTPTHAFFQARDANSNYNWYVMSADDLTPQPIETLNPLLAGQSLLSFRASGDYFYFSVQTSGTDYEYWRSDGTAAGTISLVNFAGSDKAVSRQAVNDKMLFVADRSSSFNPGDLYVSDGSVAGTGLLTAAEKPQGFTRATLAGQIDGRQVFLSSDGSEPQTWYTDGTAAGTHRIAPLTGGEFEGFTSGIVGNLDRFYAGHSTITTSDWTGTHLTSIDANVGFGWAAGGSYNSSVATETDNLMFFSITGTDAAGQNNWQLWTSDGTDDGTYVVYQVEQARSNLVQFPVVVGDRVMFVGPRDPDDLGSTTAGIFTIDLAAGPRAAGDFNGNQRHTSADLDVLWKQVQRNVYDPRFDVNGDSQVNRDDVQAWLNNYSPGVIGDRTLDGDVDIEDLLQMRQDYTRSITVGAIRPWQLSNYDGDDDTDFEDVVAMRMNLGYGDDGIWYILERPDRFGPQTGQGAADQLEAIYNVETGEIFLSGNTQRGLVALQLQDAQGLLQYDSAMAESAGFRMYASPEELVTIDTDSGTLVDGLLRLGQLINTDSGVAAELTIRYALEGDISSRLATLSLIPGSTLLGDYNGNGTVDAADYTVWQDNFNSTTNLAADGNGDGTVNAADYTIWQDHFGNSLNQASASTLIPEPGSAVLLSIVGLALTRRRRAV